MSEPAGVVPSTMIEAVEQLASAFDRFEIRYALIGALAAGYRSRPRSTRDVDFLLSIPSLKLPALLEDLKSKDFDFDPAVAIREWTQEHMLVMSFRGIRIDWLKPPIPAYAHVIDRATEEPWLHRPIRIASADGLIFLKLVAFRPQDQVDIENIVISNRATLDLDWIRTEWQTVASLDDPRMKRLLEWTNA